MPCVTASIAFLGGASPSSATPQDPRQGLRDAAGQLQRSFSRHWQGMAGHGMVALGHSERATLGRTPWASLGTEIRAPFRKAILTLSAEDLLRHEPLWLRSQAPTSCQQLAQCPLVGARQHPGVAFEHRVLRDSLTSLSAAWRRSARASDLPLELRSKLWKRPRAEIGLGRTRLNTLAAHRRSQARAHSPPGAYLSPDLFRGS